MATCPPLPSCAPPPDVDFDLTTAADCKTLLGGLWQASIAAATGNQRTRVRVGDRWTDYGRANVGELTTQYRILYNQCAAAGADLTGLPSLNPGLRSKRGPAVRQFRGPITHL